ncbi:hypothetical protein ACWGB8_30135 [Kitasatospora sp. NPDC054939]
MPIPDERSDRTLRATHVPWRATILKHTRTTGRPSYDEPPFDDGVPADDGVLAERDGLRIVGRNGAVDCVDAAGRTRWTHTFAGRANDAHLSSGRVLVTTDSHEYTAWGVLGPALLLDLADGRVVAELRGASGTVLRGGRFVLGLEGYDVFDTWEYDRDGRLVDTWRSYGHYVVGTGLRVVECDRRIPTGSRVVRLLPGGVVERGPRLRDPLCPRPVVLPDGTVLVLDAGVLRAFDRALRETVLAELWTSEAEREQRGIGSLRRRGDRLTAVLAVQHPDRPSTYTVDTWTLVLRGGGEGVAAAP